MDNARLKEKPLLRSLDSYIPAVNTARYLQGKEKILIIGDAGGREWQNLKKLGKELYIVDISPQENFPNLIVQSIEERTPFPDQFFDGVVMNEVLEHLFFDVAALEEVHRIIKPNGVLVVTVPYFSNLQDLPEFHVRVHSPKTIKRLLERCGFGVDEHFCRGFFSRLPQIKIVAAGILSLHLLTRILLRKTSEQSVSLINGIFEKLERFLGSNPLTIQFQKLFSSYGGIMKVGVRTSKRDFDEIQRIHFSNSRI